MLGKMEGKRRRLAVRWMDSINEMMDIRVERLEEPSGRNITLE